MQPSTDVSALAWGLLIGAEAVTGVALLLRRRLPLAVFVVVTSVLVTAVVVGAAQETRLSPLVVLSLAVSLYTVGNLRPYGTRTVIALLVVVVVVAVGVCINHLTAAPEYQGSSDVLAVLAPLPLAWALGTATRTHRADLASAARRMDEMTREQELREQQAAQQERVRIAGEMHDVVAHSLTLLVVRAETLRARGGELPDWARRQIDGLAVAGRQAGSELRDLLGVLRGPEESAPLQPTPGLGELPELLERGRAAGSRIAARLCAPQDLTRPVQLAVYRIVQEALTNARRHAPGAQVRVTVAADEGGVRCEVENTAPEIPGEVSWGAGLGLVSMRERVEALGGLLRAGPTREGGFRVSAAFPPRLTPLDAAGV
ncbi:histidine kinase [Streptomyces sp. NPDC005195]|uniref:sensor histidine kinase n=1 Tax=Streptomyces sp. NPDC005195 TaxID=3154561 RepID=UPI0033A4C44E